MMIRSALIRSGLILSVSALALAAVAVTDALSAGRFLAGLRRDVTGLVLWWSLVSIVVTAGMCLATLVLVL